MPEHEYLTTAEVAHMLRTSPESVRWWRHVGRGPKSFRVGRRVLYDRRDVDAFITDVRQGQVPASGHARRATGPRAAV